MALPRDGYRKGLRRFYDWLEAKVKQLEESSGGPVTWDSIEGKPTIPTLPSKGTATELQTGTSTTNRLWDAKTIHDEIARQIAAANGG